MIARYEPFQCANRLWGWIYAQKLGRRQVAAIFDVGMDVAVIREETLEDL